MSKICNPSCISGQPPAAWANGCEMKKLKGGICRLVFSVCDEAYTHPNPDGWANIANIVAAMDAGKLFITGSLVGNKDKGSFETRRLQSCSPEETISATKTIQVSDFNGDLAGQEDVDFWNYIRTNKDYLDLGFITSDDRFFMVTGNWDVQVDDVIEDSQQGQSFYDATFMYDGLDILKPYHVPGLLNALSAYQNPTSS